MQNGFFSWDAVGLEWTVPIEEATVFVALPEPTGTNCRAGTPWFSKGCSLTTLASGALRIDLADLDANEGATVSASLGSGVIPALPSAPSGAAEDPGSGVVAPALIAVLAALAGAAAATILVRRAGRERVWSGGAADAAFGESEDGLGSRLMDEAELAELATIEFEPPRDMSAVEGALLLREQVHDEHLSAWLLEAAIRGEIDISDDDDPVITHGTAPPHPTVHQILDRMFDGRSSIKLGSYDADFTEGWSQLKGELDDWLHGSAHWDTAGRRRQTVVRIVGAIALVVGLGIGGFAVFDAAITGLGPAPLIATGAAIAGAALGAIISSYELLVRTETGSALWLRVESFRRFLENSRPVMSRRQPKRACCVTTRPGLSPSVKPRLDPRRRSSGRRRPAGAVDDRPRPGVPPRRIIDHERSEVRVNRAVEFGRRWLLRRIRWWWRRRWRRFVVAEGFAASQLSPT